MSRRDRGQDQGAAEERRGACLTHVTRATEAATPAFRTLVRQVLDGRAHSVLPGARRFFEPDAQDRAFGIAEHAREKKRKGELLTEQEQRLLKYRRSAQQVRMKWLLEGSRFVDRIGSVEFYT